MGYIHPLLLSSAPFLSMNTGLVTLVLTAFGTPNAGRVTLVFTAREVNYDRLRMNKVLGNFLKSAKNKNKNNVRIAVGDHSIRLKKSKYT